jgi:hypothetical protein
MEEQPPIWRVAANILNKQSRTADKGWTPDWVGGGLGGVLTTPYSKRITCYEIFTEKASDLNRYFVTCSG